MVFVWLLARLLWLSLFVFELFVFGFSLEWWVLLVVFVTCCLGFGFTDNCCLVDCLELIWFWIDVWCFVLWVLVNCF